MRSGKPAILRSGEARHYYVCEVHIQSRRATDARRLHPVDEGQLQLLRQLFVNTALTCTGVYKCRHVLGRWNCLEARSSGHAAKDARVKADMDHDSWPVQDERVGWRAGGRYMQEPTLNDGQRSRPVDTSPMLEG